MFFFFKMTTNDYIIGKLQHINSVDVSTTGDDNDGQQQVNDCNGLNRKGSTTSQRERGQRQGLEAHRVSSLGMFILFF